MWTEHFGPELNGVVETVKNFLTKKNYLLSEPKKVKKYSARASFLKRQLKPIYNKLKKFKKVIKTLE